MKSFLLLLTGLVLLAGVLGLTVFRGGESRAGYTIDLEHSGTGTASIVLRLSGLDLEEFELYGALSDQLLDVSELRVVDDGGHEIPVERFSESRPSGVYTRYRVALEPDSDSVSVQYRVKPATYLPPNEEREYRQCGTLGPRGCALSLPHVALIPSFPLSEISLETKLPPDWRTAVDFPEGFDDPVGDVWWEGVLVAGRYEEVEQALTDNMLVSVFEGTPPEVPPVLGRILGRAEQIFGPRHEPLHVVLAPFEEESAPIELPALVKTLVTDVRRADLGSLRKFIRNLVPAWFDRTRADVEADSSKEGWFLIGLSEHLAQSILDELGLVPGDPATAVERTWMFGEGVRGVDLEASENQPLWARRLAGGTVLHELERASPGLLPENLRGYVGRGYPTFSRAESSSAFDAFLESTVRAHPRHLSFEDDWELELSDVPASAAAAGDDLMVSRVLDIAYTSETVGYLENCGCKQVQSGGIAHRSAALDALRSEKPGLLLFDLGNFSPIDEGRARLDPLVDEEFRVYLEAMVRITYDGVVVGSDDLYCGSEHVRSGYTSKLPLLGLGIRLDGTELFGSSQIIERAGFRVGFIGFSSLLEGGSSREANESNLLGITIPGSLDDLLTEIRRLEPQVDFLIVGGRMKPSDVEALGEPGLGVDLVLLGGFGSYEGNRGQVAGFVNDTAVAFQQISYYGFDHLTIALSKDNRPVAVDQRSSFLDKAGPVDAEIKGLIDDFNSSLATRPELLGNMKKLFAHDPWQRDDYVGAASCAACHPSQYGQWKGTPHASAMLTLTNIRRDRHPKCVQCHVLGFETQTGYRLAQPDAKFTGVQCETCHGAGGAHVKAPQTGKMRRTPPQQVCVECHDSEHSDDFEGRFHQAWSEVVH